MYREIKLISPSGKIKIIDAESDVVLLILSILGIGWIKLLIDGRVGSGLINILLMYTLLGNVIHGCYLALKPGSYIKKLVLEGYRPVAQEDKESVKMLIGIDVECANF